MATRAIAFSGFAFTSVSFIRLCVTTFNGFYLLRLRPVPCCVSYLRPSQTAFSGFAYGDWILSNQVTEKRLGRIQNITSGNVRKSLDNNVYGNTLEKRKSKLNLPTLVTSLLILSPSIRLPF